MNFNIDAVSNMSNVNFGDYMKYYVLPKFGIKLATKATVFATEQARNLAARAITCEGEATEQFKAALKTNMENIKDQMEKSGSSHAGSKLLSANSSIEDAMLVLQSMEDNERLVMKTSSYGTSYLVPESFQFKIPDRAARLLESASIDASTAFHDHANNSLMFRITAIKIQIICTLLLNKDEPKLCTRLIQKLLTTMCDDRNLKKFFSEKKLTKKTMLTAKTAIHDFTMELMRDLPALHTVGFRFDNLPPFMECLATPNCIPLGWWEGLPVMCINGNSICDVPWDNNIYIDSLKCSNKMEQLLDTNLFEFQPCTAGARWSTLSAVVNKQIFEQNLEEFNSQIDKNEIFEYSTLSGEQKEAYYCQIELKKYLTDGLCVWTSSECIVVYSDQHFFVTWPLTSVKHVEWNKYLSSLKSCDVIPTVIFMPVEIKQKGITRLLYAEDDGQEKITVYALNGETIGKFVIMIDKTYVEYTIFITIPSAKNLGVSPDLLRWSAVNGALVNVSVQDDGIFQFRLISKDGIPSSHSVVSVSDWDAFPPKFQWKQFDKVDEAERLMYKRENDGRKFVIFKNDCIFLCRSFRFEKGSLIFVEGEQEKIVKKKFRMSIRRVKSTKKFSGTDDITKHEQHDVHEEN